MLEYYITMHAKVHMTCGGNDRRLLHSESDYRFTLFLTVSWKLAKTNPQTSWEIVPVQMSASH